MKIWEVYADTKGESHFRESEIPWAVGTWRGAIATEPVKNSGVIFRETSGPSQNDWHVAPRKQIVLNWDSGFAITTSDGATRIFERGEPMMLTDTHGKGHKTVSLNTTGSRRGMFIPLE